MTLRNAKTLFTGSVCLAMILEVILICFIAIWYIRRQRAIEIKLCLTDDSLHPELRERFSLTYGKDKKRNEKCFKGLDALKAIVSKLMASHYDTDMNPEPAEFDLTIFNLSESTEEPALMLLNDIKSFGPSDHENASHIMWKSVTKQGDGLINLAKEGMIAIQKSGYYFVTSHLTFMKENKTSSVNDDETGKHQVIRISNKTDQQSILLESTSYRCQMHVKQCEQSSYVAAAFKLEESDRIFVTVSHKFQILSGNGTHYFSIVEI